METAHQLKWTSYFSLWCWSHVLIQWSWLLSWPPNTNPSWWWWVTIINPQRACGMRVYSSCLVCLCVCVSISLSCLLALFWCPTRGISAWPQHRKCSKNKKPCSLKLLSSKVSFINLLRLSQPFLHMQYICNGNLWSHDLEHEVLWFNFPSNWDNCDQVTVSKRGSERYAHSGIM